MEGYTDITNSLDSFDDLDIEGKSVSDDWNGKDDTSFKPKNSKQSKNLPAGFDEKALLSEKVLLNDGSQGFCYTVKEQDRCMRWTCHVCNTTVPGAKNFQLHLLGKKHEGNMLLPHHDRSKFTKILNKKDVDKLQLAPGEPVPPGFEDEVEAVLQIQPTLDNYKMSPLIGLEYLVELLDSTKEPQYNCMLCNKKGDPRTVISHLISTNHRLSYIEKHFSLTFNAINNLPKAMANKKGEIVTRVASKIEEKYGRLPPVIAEADSFELKRETITAQIERGTHFSEAPDDVFVDLVDKNLVTIGIKADEVPPAEKESKESKEKESKPVVEPDDDDEVEFQGAFIKGTRVAVDRSALRVRKIEDMLETEDKKTSVALKKAADTKKRKVGGTLKALSPLSTISSASSGSVRSLRRTLSRSPSHGLSHRRVRSRSRSRSRSRNRLLRLRYQRRSRSVSRGRRRRSRSRSRSRSRRRSRSGSRGRRLRSPYGSYRSSRSTRDRPRPYSDHKKEEKKDKVEDLTTEKAKWERFREDCDKVEKDLRDELKYHEKNPEKHPQYPEEWKLFWNRRYKELQAMGIDPSKHDFKPEWIEFWNKRMREMHEAEFCKKKEEIRERLGLPPDNPDPSLIKPRFPRKRPAIDHLADQLEPISPEEEKRDPVAEMKSTWKAFTGSDIRDSKVRSRSPSPWEDNIGRSRTSPPDMRRGPKEMRVSKELDFGANRYRRESSRPYQEGVRTISVLRTLTALENQLGSLGPKVNTLLSEAIALDKLHSGNSDAILANDENCVLFETVKEKLKGQLYAGIIDRNMVNPTKQAIQSITDLLAKAPSLLEHVKPMPVKKAEPPVVIAPMIVEEPPIVSEPVTVPGIGAVDKIAIAQQIAAALVAQGKTDVTQEELEQLINAVVGMAQASVDAQEPISTAEFVSSLTKAAEAPAPAPAQAAASPLDGTESFGADENSRGVATPSEERRSVSSDILGISSETIDSADVRPTSRASTVAAAPVSKSTPLSSSNAAASATPTTGTTEPRLAANASPPPPKNSVASRLVRSGYGHEDLTEDDLKMLLQNFKDLSTEEQHGLIVYLKKLEATDMDRVEKLRKFVNLGPPAAATSVTAPAAAPTAALAAMATAPPVQASVQAVIPKPVETTLVTPKESSRTDAGPLSPFSLRHGGANPTRDLDAKRARDEALGAKLMELDDSDDDYTFEDVYAAASQKVKEKMAEEERKAKEKQAEEARLREERERDRLEKEEQDKKVKEERERKEKADVDKWEAGNAAAAAMVTATQIPSALTAQTDHNLLLKQTTEVLDDLMGNLPSRFKQAAATGAATTAASVQPTATGAAVTARQIPVASGVSQQVDAGANPPFTNFYSNPPFNQPPPQNSQPQNPAANGYNHYYNQADHYRQLVYPGQPDQNPSNAQNQVPVPMAQNPYPSPQVQGGYYPNQPPNFYQGQNYQNPGNYQSYGNSQQMYGQGYGQQMYPQQPNQYGQYNQQSYY